MVTDSYGGPIDYIVFEFPPGAEADDGFAVLLDCVDAGTISVLDLEVIGRDPDGNGQRLDPSELPVQSADLAAVFRGAESRVLDDDDLNAVAASIADGWVAVAIVYEERSFAEIAAAWGSVGGQLLLAGGVEPEQLDDALTVTSPLVEEI